MKTNLNTSQSSNSSSNSNNINSGQMISLQQLLKEAELLEYLDKMKNILKLRHAGDLIYTEEKDLTSIGMSRPEQKRLKQTYSRLCPQTNGVLFKLKKVFGKNDKNNDYINTSTINQDNDDQQHVIPVSNIQLCKELGSGEFGHVYLSSWTQNNGEVIQVAVKRVLPDKLIANPTSFLQEAAIMTKMRHDNVVRLYGVVLDTKSVMLVSELAPCGSLLECVQNPALRKSFPVDILCSFAIQIAYGMQYLASERLIHRDLAARNVLVFNAEKVKISDFGLSRSLGIGEDYYKSEFNPSMKLPIAWCAPECINYLRFTEKSDVWSYGVTLWEMFSYGDMPWRGYNGSQILQAIDQKGQRLDCPKACPSEFYTLMQKCWKHNPDDRLTFDHLAGCLPSMMPQLLVTVKDSNNADKNELKFKRNDIIILINRCPEGLLDNSDFWLGSMKDGQIGLFKPSDTVAYLGAESPNPCVPINLKNTSSIKKKDIKQLPIEKKKLLISEPQGDVRHTCHVGIDGQSFGLLQVDKNELSKALPPTFRKTESDNEISKVPPRPAPRKIPVSPTTPVRHISSEKNVFPLNIDTLDNKKPPPLFPRGVSTPNIDIPLPPKPNRKQAEPLIIENKLASPTNSLNRRTVSTDTNIVNEFNERKKQLIHTIHIDSDSSDYNTNDSCHSSNPESVLDQVLSELQQDITNFSIQTTSTTTTNNSNYSDTCPLLNDKNNLIKKFKNNEIVDNNGELRYMTDNEFEIFKKLSEKEDKKIDKKLERQRTIEKKDSKKFENESKIKSSSLSPSTLGKYTESIKNNDWTPEAQSAYKFLVECGTKLQSTTSPVHERSSSRSSNNSSTNTELTVIAGTQYSRASAPPEDVITPNSTIKNDYENNNKNIPPIPAPPKVPPKPKLPQKIEAHKVESGFITNLNKRESVKL